ncbi:carbohydrate ABC transporter membrane protein 1 (CUT1 family) [Scopulibacillus darangshiensis]|uniref:Carbohydrate ABC transporter membrane protein 1 (CUT1 family) n=1 Tax=Scopulibacillus darangshiensis TaxID=442528 RepID=A0A4R2NJ59_9BACL|nr:ABC transporter permease subunit [Scopulibacillus darangshiensis]TCP21338.1 carbohydrate ABC transporter membrane protein 1 (CUT1 family) [Scopulibacillus darangshiensis]
MAQLSEINISAQPNKSPNKRAEIKKKSLWVRIWEHKIFYLFLLPGIIWFIIFAYIPMYGVTIAFKDFNFAEGIIGSDWVGFKYFKQFFDYYQSWDIIRNTLVISLLKLVFGFPMPIILALLINEVRARVFKRAVQTISYLPHFISWVVVVTLMDRLLTPYGGPINGLIHALGFNEIAFMGNIKTFYPLVILSDIWKSVGWNTIIYLAAIAGIDPQLYEAAKMDGAGRFRQMWHVTLPSIKGVMVILFILATGSIMKAGFEQLLLLNTPATNAIGNVLDVYQVHAGLEQGRFSYAAAVGLFQGLIALILVVTANRISKKVNETSLW